jgi:mRNA interferase MazF
MNEYIKNFWNWHTKKSEIHNDKGRRVYFNEREIWWCSLGLNVGYEQDGKGENFTRPVIILKQFNKEVFWALPLTTQPKVGKYYFPIDLGDNRERRITLSQLRLVDAKRLKNKVGVLPEEQFKVLKKAVIALLQ